MAKEDIIRGVICPDCGREMYRHVMNGTSKNLCMNESSEFYDWRCPNCIYVYSELWLNDKRFNDFPFLVCRYSDGRDKLYNISAFRESNLLAFQKSGLKFKDWLNKNKKGFERFKVLRI